MNVFSGNHGNEQIGSELNCSIGKSLDQICKLSKRPINDEILILFKRIYTHNELFSILGVTTDNISLFTYEEGKSHAFYFNANYVPTFLDEEEFSFDDSALGQQARDVCGDNRQCMFDIHTTRRVNIGMASKQAVESFIEVNIATQTQGR